MIVQRNLEIAQKAHLSHSKIGLKALSINKLKGERGQRGIPNKVGLGHKYPIHGLVLFRPGFPLC